MITFRRIVRRVYDLLHLLALILIPLILMACVSGCITDQVKIDGKIGNFNYLSLAQKAAYEAAIKANPALAAVLRPDMFDLDGKPKVDNPVAGIKPERDYFWVGEQRIVEAGNKISGSDVVRRTRWELEERLADIPMESAAGTQSTNTYTLTDADKNLINKGADALKGMP